MNEIMGQTASRVGGRSNGLIVTLDALGTLYKFRKPIATQYLDAAKRAGVEQKIEPNQLLQAFKQSYKEQVLRYPNYGLGTLGSPAEWWEILVKATFSQLIEDVPEALPKQLYDHFSSAEAYELHSDVQPFLQSLHNLRSQFADADGPSVFTGIITNSDPRVSQVLKALSLQIGDIRIPTREEIRESATASANSGKLQTPWSNAYDNQNDFDFLVTGYEAGAEKPDTKIWAHADYKAKLVAISKSQKGMILPEGKLSSTFAVIASAVRDVNKTDTMQWIHIGDEYEKDYLSAKAFGKEALLLDREDLIKEKADKVGSLEEAATVVNLMAQEMLKQNDH